MLQLRRVTTSASWIPQIDGLRFIAIMAVLQFHAAGQVGSRGPRPLVLEPHLGQLMVGFFGDRGVQLFFVISGYILARPFLREHLLEGRHVALGQYYLRRLTRLEPPYLAALVLYALRLRFGNHQPWGEIAPHWVATAFYQHNLIFHAMSTVSFVTWSLEVEVQFYVLAPLLGELYRLRNTALRRGVLAALIVGSAVASLTVPAAVGTESILHYGHYFLTGFLLADLLDYPRHAGGTNLGWDAVGLLAWATLFHLPRASWTFAVLPLLILPAYWAAFHGRLSNWFFRQPLVALTGGMCYSIYLLHMLTYSGAFLLIRRLQFTSPTATFLTEMALLIPCALLAGLVFFVLVERPCMDPEWPRKLWRWLRGSHAVVGAA